MPIKVKISFFRRHFACGVCGLVLGVVGAVAASDFRTNLQKLTASHGVGEFQHISIESLCNHSTPQVDSGLETIEVPVTAGPDDLLGDWIVLSHPGWSCFRQFRYGFPGNTQALPLCADPMHLNKNTCYPPLETTLRHWLHGYVSESQYVKDISVEGATYSVYRGSSWSGAHPMAGLGFILKYEANIAGNTLIFPIDVPSATGPLGTFNYGPYVSITHQNQILPSGSLNTGANYSVSDAKVSFRMVLIADSPDNIKNSDNNDFLVTYYFTLGVDNCGWHMVETFCVQASNMGGGTHFYAHLNIRHAAPTCDTPSVTVPMPTVPLTEFTATNAVSAHSQSPFTIKLINCSYAIRRNVSYSLSASSGTSPDPSIGLVPLAGSSAAAGVDVQILDGNKTPLPLDTFHSAYAWAPGNPAISSLDINLYAQLRRRGDETVTPGPYEAAATVVIQYP